MTVSTSFKIKDANIDTSMESQYLELILCFCFEKITYEFTYFKRFK